MKLFLLVPGSLLRLCVRTRARAVLLTASLSAVSLAGCSGGSSVPPTPAPSNPSPAISSISPASANAGSAAFTLTVNGSGFISGSTVQWGGNARSTTYVSGSEVTASIGAADVVAGGNVNVTVSNPSPGGGTSAAAVFAVDNPLPAISSLSPTIAVVAGAPFTLTVTGSNFVSGSTVQWGGNSLTTTYHSATQLTASVPAADLASAGSVKVTVVNAAPGGGTSSAAAFTVATIVADSSGQGAAMFPDQLGVNVNVGFSDDSNAAFLPLYADAGIKLFRYPGGYLSDFYHWQTHSYSKCSPFTAPPAATSFDKWMAATPIARGADVAITVNYATNPTCTGPADPNEAAQWVNYANVVNHYGVKYWTVGNEQYLWNGTTAAAYASAVANHFYPLMKAQDPTISVGVDVWFGNGGYSSANDTWDPVVLANAKYDFVEMHYYPEGNNQNNDAELLSKWADQVATNFSTMKAMLTQAGKANTPIFLGEFDRDFGDNGTPGHQSLSVVNALFTAIVVAESAKAGVPMVAAWSGLDYCWADVQPASTAYGWQNFGSWGLFAATGTGFSESCADKGVPGLTVLPKGAVYQILSQYIVQGANVIQIQSGDSAVRAYASESKNGLALLLINTDGSATHTPVIAFQSPSGSYSATALTYGKAQYDLSKNGTWAGPVTTSLGTVSLDNFSVALPPWSVTLVTLAP